MMIRDHRPPCDHAYMAILSGVRLWFDAGGILRDPTAEQLAASQATAVRRDRFAIVEEPRRRRERPSSPPENAPSVTAPAASVDPPKPPDEAGE